MKRVPATNFIKNIGRFLRGAEEGPVLVMSHNHESAVLVSAREYRRLAAADAAFRATKSPPQARAQDGISENDPTEIAASIVSTSIRNPVSWSKIVDAIRGKTTDRNLLSIFLVDVDERLMSALVERQALSWKELEKAAVGIRGIGNEKASFIRDMARFELGNSSRLGPTPA